MQEYQQLIKFIAQLDALKNAGCDEIYEEKKSGVADREELEKALGYLREGDTLVVTKLDRLGRSLKKLLELVEEFKERGIHFQSLDDGIDTSTSVGNFFFQVIGAFSELERNLIVERTQKGLKAARSRGFGWVDGPKSIKMTRRKLCIEKSWKMKRASKRLQRAWA